jgi:murein tripeptide amidase MpaA
MHGNESTTTKALFDFLNVLHNGSALAIKLDTLLCCIPMLNPDGAKYLIHVNANEVDLNRDSQNLTQPESKV